MEQGVCGYSSGAVPPGRLLERGPEPGVPSAASPRAAGENSDHGIPKFSSQHQVLVGIMAKCFRN